MYFDTEMTSRIMRMGAIQLPRPLCVPMRYEAAAVAQPQPPRTDRAAKPMCGSRYCTPPRAMLAFYRERQAAARLAAAYRAKDREEIRRLHGPDRAPK